MLATPESLTRRVAELECQLADERIQSAKERRDLERAARQHQKQHNKDRRLIDQLHAQLRALQQQRFTRSSEKHPGQVELQFFNEAELTQ